MSKITGHFQEYIGRYVVLLMPVLTGVAALCGAVAADLGGVNTSIGRAVSAVGTAAAAGAAACVWLRNLGAWQIAEVADVRSITEAGVETVPSPRPDVPRGEPRSGV